MREKLAEIISSLSLNKRLFMKWKESNIVGIRFEISYFWFMIYYNYNLVFAQWNFI